MKERQTQTKNGIYKASIQRFIDADYLGRNCQSDHDKIAGAKSEGKKNYYCVGICAMRVNICFS